MIDLSFFSLEIKIREQREKRREKAKKNREKRRKKRKILVFEDRLFGVLFECLSEGTHEKVTVNE